MYESYKQQTLCEIFWTLLSGPVGNAKCRKIFPFSSLLSIMIYICNLILRWQKQEDQEFKANLSYYIRTCLRKEVVLGKYLMVEHLPSMGGARMLLILL